MPFSGIVELMGSVKSLEERNDLVLWDGTVSSGVILTVENADVALSDAYEGCSIAVNGVCLTVKSYTASQFSVGLAPETLRRTNLGQLKPGDLVNVERALASGSRNSGHLVQGHVDGTGTIENIWKEGDSLWFRVSFSTDYLRFIVPKGYVAIDGTSLTVCEKDTTSNSFTFMLIEITQKKIIVARKRIGEKVNIEVDVIGKMVESAAKSFIDAALQESHKREEKLAQSLAALEERVASLERMK
jgi:riboflavin synthase